jgi:hypothetical protein
MFMDFLYLLFIIEIDVDRSLFAGRRRWTLVLRKTWSSVEEEGCNDRCVVRYPYKEGARWGLSLLKGDIAGFSIGEDMVYPADWISFRSEGVYWEVMCIGYLMDAVEPSRVFRPGC